MSDYRVVAWNFVNSRTGKPKIEINEDMTAEEYRRRVAGRYVFEHTQLLEAGEPVAVVLGEMG